MLKEFKEFAVKGNVVDLAVGVIIGAAFGKIVSSFVSDVLMPPLGMLMGKIDLKARAFDLIGPEIDVAGKVLKEAVTIRYGIFLNNVIDFLFVAFSVFLMVKAINKLKKQPPAPTSDLRECPKCITSISKKASRCAHCTSDVAPVA